MTVLKKIWLQDTGDDDGEVGETTWCQDRINDTDIEYRLASDYDALAAELAQANYNLTLCTTAALRHPVNVKRSEPCFTPTLDAILDLVAEHDAYQARAKTAEARVQALQKLKPFIEEVWQWHRDENDQSYNECEIDECAWCSETRATLAAPASKGAQS